MPIWQQAFRPQREVFNDEEAGTMGCDYKVIDADGHILEPVDLWDNYMEPAFRVRAPRMFVDTDGTIIGGPRGLGRLGGIGLRDGRVPEEMKYVEGRKGGSLNF